MSIYGAPAMAYPSSPIMAPSSPLMMAQQQPQPFSPPSGQSIQPGQITYTSTTSPDGRVIYHPFKAVPASYQTPNGIVTGIQWIPAEATSVLPANAIPANEEFEASWRSGPHSKHGDRAHREWQRDEEKRRRREEKEAGKRVAQWEKDRRDRDKEDREFRRAREADARASRRLSGNYNAVPSVAGSTGSGYSNPYSMGDLESRIDEAARRDYERDRRRRSGVYGDDPYNGATSPYATSAAGGFTAAGFPSGHRPSSPYNVPGTFPPPSPRSAAPPLGYPSSPSRTPLDIYQRPSSPYHGPGSNTVPNVYNDGPRSRAPSPMPTPGGMPYPRSRAASPNPYGVRSRAASPMPMSQASGMPQATMAGMPGRGPSPRPSPRMGGTAQLMSSGYPGEPQSAFRPPEGFSRPPNLAQAYTFFDIMKIQDMDEFYDNMPRMPLVLVPHDVYHEDWIRFMQDLALAWAGKLPTADGVHTRHTKMTANLVDTWNSSFFTQRGVEVVLFKGRERRTGPGAGIVESDLPGFNSDDDDSSSESSDSSDSDLSDDRYGRSTPYGPYGRPADPYSAEMREARRRRREKKQDKKRREKEKKAKKKAMEKEKKYAVYISCIPNNSFSSPY